MCCISVPPSATASSCCAAADAEHRHVARQRAAHQRELGGGAALLQRDGRVAVAVAVQAGIDVEGAAGDDQRVDAVEVVRRPAPASCGSATGRPPAAASASA